MSWICVAMSAAALVFSAAALMGAALLLLARRPGRELPEPELSEEELRQWEAFLNYSEKEGRDG